MSDMSAVALTLELARLHLGIQVQETVRGDYIIVSGDTVIRRYDKRAWAVKHVLKVVPNWPTDTDAALSLCLEIAREQDYALEIEPDWDDEEPIVSVRLESCRMSTVAITDAATPALALSRLALLALRERE